MMWLWLVLVWSSLSCVVGVLLGVALRKADINDQARSEVDEALVREFAEL